MVFHTLIKCN